MKNYTIEELIELAKTTSGQVAVLENGTFLNENDYARLKDKTKAILLHEVINLTPKKKAPKKAAKEA